MGVTMIVCSKLGCGRVLNGELCKFFHGAAYCNEHAKKCYRFGCQNVATQEYRDMKSNVFGEPVCDEHQVTVCDFGLQGQCECGV